jgi:hypothetical protein
MILAGYRPDEAAANAQIELRITDEFQIEDLEPIARMELEALRHDPFYQNRLQRSGLA